MALVEIDSDEWYPVYGFVETERGVIDVSQDRLGWWQRATDDFLAAQEDMSNAAQEAHERRADRVMEQRVIPVWPKAGA